MRITSKGQVTIPKDLRERFRLLPHTEVEFIADANGLRLIPRKDSPGRGDALLNHMCQHQGSTGMTTDEIMELTRAEEHDLR